MAIKILEILVEGVVAGSIILNGSNETNLKKFKMKKEYEERLTRKNLLIQGQDYCSFKPEEYILTIQNALRKDIGKKISIREKKLPLNAKRKLIRQYSI